MTRIADNAALRAELSAYAYECDPRICGENNCCKKFDIALTVKEQRRFREILPALREFCPWLTEVADEWLIYTRHFVFLKKYHGFCALNYFRDGGYFCAWHSFALDRGQNPYREKPRGCAGWPFLESDGANLTLDQSAPCLTRKTGETPDKNLLALLTAITENPRYE